MRIRFAAILILLALSGWRCDPPRKLERDHQALQASALFPFGRFDWNAQQDLELISSGVHFGFAFTGETCKLYAYLSSPSGHNYLQYELDGVYQKRIRVEGDSSAPYIIKAPASGTHIVWIYKATEAATGPVYVRKVEGAGLNALKSPNAPLIEFIGNSITCGALADPSDVPCGAGVYQDQHNAYSAYGPRVARAIGAGFILSSVSGIGVYRNWNSDGPTMPQVYEKTDLRFQGTRNWDFTRYTPRIVSIALGTNDYSDGNGENPRLSFDSSRFVRAYTGFVKQVKSKYPAAQIALLSSPMLNNDRREILQRCLASVKKEIDASYPDDKPVAVFFFKPMSPHGCSWHPSVEDHAVMAEELIPFFKGLL